MNHRRDFLKLFGVGASVVPLLAGVPEMQAESKLIEVPKVELFDATKLNQDQVPKNLYRLLAERAVCTMCILSPSNDGAAVAFVVDAVAANMAVRPVDVTSEVSRVQEFLPGIGSGEITLTMRLLSRPVISKFRI